MTTLPRLLVVSDGSQVPPGRTLRTTLLACLDGGATHVVLRELDQAVHARAELAAALADAGAVVVAAHTAVPGAIGVQLPAGAARGRGWFGRSCHSAAEVVAAGARGAAYVTLSPFAPSASKPGRRPLPRAQFAAVRDSRTPVFALGGIDASNAAAAIEAGAYGIAVMGALMRAPDPAAVTALLLTAVGAAR